MIEKDFALSLVETVKRFYEDAVVWRPNDGFTSGLPDIIAIRPPYGTVLGIEAKALHRLLLDPWDPGRRTGEILPHPFSGPQISTMRRWVRAGAQACGIIRVTANHAFVIAPDAIPPNGNFTHAELVASAKCIERNDGMWPFLNLLG